MNILFVTYGELCLHGNGARSAAIVQALADAGHQVDVLATRLLIPEHPAIRWIAQPRGGYLSRMRLCLAVFRASRRHKYDVVHAVDVSALCVERICRLRRMPLVYEAVRRFSGKVGVPPRRVLKWFPRRLQRIETRLLDQASVVVASSGALIDDLLTLVPDANIVQVDDIPIQPLLLEQEFTRTDLLEHVDGFAAKTLVVWSIQSGSRASLRLILLAARKVAEALPDVAFFFRGFPVEAARTLAGNLEIHDRCVFLDPEELSLYVGSLQYADVAVLVPRSGYRYACPDTFTLLYSPAPVVVVQDVAHEHLLNEQNCISVLPNSQSIAEGIIRMIREPLFSMALAAQGQQLVASSFSHSSFKHKVRMVYRALRKKG